MLEWDADFILGLLLKSADIARQIKNDPQIAVKNDRTPVSDADREIEKLLSSELGSDHVLGEETFQRRDHRQLIEQLLHGRIWIIDPIDGTANFINRRPLWGITVGYAENGVIVRGGIFLPEFGQLLITGNDGTSLLAETGKPYPERGELEHAMVPAKHPGKKFDMTSCINLSQVFTKRGRFSGPNPVIAIGSCICSGMDLVLGRDAVYMTHAKLWDMAGMLPNLAQLGFYSGSRSGQDLLSCRITPEIFQLEEDAKTPFALREMQWIGSSRQAVETIMPLCEI